MKISERSHLLLYQKLGELFYAIAASDKEVRKQEFDALKQLIKTEWSSIDDYKDQFQTDAVYQMEIVFDWFEYEHKDSQECYKNFSNFYKENKKLFTYKMKQLIWKTVNAIANAFAGKNKAEVVMLTQLLMLLQDKN